jgi:ABC-2 type transport system ATP-binding protein
VSTVPETSIVRADGIARCFGAVEAVADVSFDIERGEMFGLIGPDGAGKTTTLRMVLGLLRPDRGSVRTCGLDPAKQARILAGRVGYLSQRFSNYGDLSVDENIGFFAEAHGVAGWKPRREELLEMLRLAPFRKRLADRLSGGMKQKLALACTLIHRPELLVLDEPTTGVDPVSRRDLWSILVRLQAEGLSLLLTTPYLDEAERCRRVALMHRGRILAAETPAAIRARHAGALFEVLAEPRQRAAEVLQDPAASWRVSSVQTFGERLHVSLDSVGADGADAARLELAGRLASAGLRVESIRAIEPTLEDVFIASVRSGDGNPFAAGGGSS